MTAKITELSDIHDTSLRALLNAEEMGYHAQSLIDHRQRRYEKLYIALTDDEAVGFLEGTFSDLEVFSDGELPPPRARIVHLLVSSHHRRTGIGTALVHRFVLDAQAAQLDSLVLYPDPQERMAFYTRCRLRPTGNPDLIGAPLETIRTALT